MRAAANFGFSNRQLLMHQNLRKFCYVFCCSWQDLGMDFADDAAHNIAKLEEHRQGKAQEGVGSPQGSQPGAFPARDLELLKAFRYTGQPVIIPGDMGRASCIGLVGRQHAACIGTNLPWAAGNEPHRFKKAACGGSTRNWQARRRDRHEHTATAAETAKSLQVGRRRGECRPRGGIQQRRAAR